MPKEGRYSLESLEEVILQRERQMFGLACIIRQLRTNPYDTINRYAVGVCDISDEGLRALGITNIEKVKETRSRAG